MPDKYKIILVDDEDEVRGRIASKIDDNSGFEIVGKAGNGYDALELIEKHKPDVVLTDIKMPFIDGIELARIIRRDYPMIRIAFITGYDEFNYAKKAIELRVVKYLMKPVTANEINTFLVELKTSLDEEYQEKQDILLVKERYNNLLPVIGDSFLISLINTNKLNDFHYEKLKLYGIDVSKHQRFITCLVRVSKDGVNATEMEQLKVNTNEMFKKVFEDIPFKHSLLVADGLVLIFSLGKLQKNDIDILLLELIESTKQYIDADITIGVSNIYDEFYHFPNSYSESKKALSYGNNYDFGNVVYIDEVNDVDVSSTKISINEFSEFDRLLHYGETKEISKALENIKQAINSGKEYYNLDLLKIEMSSLIIYLAKEASVNVVDVTEGDLVRFMNQASTMDELFDKVNHVLLAVKELDIRKQLTRSEKTIQKAKEYINENYQNSELSLEQLSDHLNVSLSHLSMLFKKHSGYNFSSYLIQVRMETAKNILKTSDLKIVDVSHLCGYSDVYYFSHSFKKYTGHSPKKFREL